MAKEARELAAFFSAKGLTDLAGTMNVVAREAERSGVHELPVEHKAVLQVPPKAPEIYIPRKVEGLVIPTKEQVVGAARKELKAFFGEEMDVPEPQDELFHTLERFEQLGIRGFEPHYLPQHELCEKDRLLGWKVKPEAWFWQTLKGGSIEKGATTLQEGWYLVDGRGKPQYSDGQQQYEDDYLAPLMDSLRVSNSIQAYPYIPQNSRFGGSPDEIEQTILPEFTKQAQPEGAVRNMRFIEFNVWGNIAHPEWGKTNTWQWFADKFGGSGRLFGGRSGDGGLSRVGGFWSVYRYVDAGFSPVVAFSSKAR